MTECQVMSSFMIVPDAKNLAKMGSLILLGSSGNQVCVKHFFAKNGYVDNSKNKINLIERRVRHQSTNMPTFYQCGRLIFSVKRFWVTFHLRNFPLIVDYFNICKLGLKSHRNINCFEFSSRIGNFFPGKYLDFK